MQSDLIYVLSAGHGEFERLVVAPGDAEEAFYLTGLAMNISWKYQMLSIVISDKEVSESTFSFDEKNTIFVTPQKPLIWNGKGSYLRYKETKNGISPLSFPGTKGALVKGTGYEHNEMGIATEDEKEIELMQNKRMRKYELMKKEVNKIKNSKKAVMAWGLTKGPAIEAAEKLGIKVIQPLILNPFPESQIKKALLGVNQLLVVEVNTD
ncbi:MAG: hypothetical protein KY054_01465 [Candidatus Nealsonbacteria bacterium]|nr:hypothetical protein [Candidatus Nealsonbacteria bacterium]